MRRVRIAVVVSAIAAFVSTSATAQAVADFKTPGNAAYCGVSHAPPWSLICWTPNDGFTISMTARSKPGFHYAETNKGYHDSFVGQVLRFGERWQRGPWTCASKRTGLTCHNRADHGWWLGRFRDYRVF